MNNQNRMMGRLGGKRSVLALVAVLLVLCVAVGGTVAYLTSSTGPVTNTFTPGKVDNTVTETTSGNVKSNVFVKNETGNIDAYIRAKIVVSWVNIEDPNKVYATQPVLNQDYTMELNNADWQQFDDTYYFKGVVPAGGQTDNLIIRCEMVSKPENQPDGYTLQVTILSESIQADGMASENKTAVADAWGYEFNNGTWTAVSADAAEP